MEAFRECYVFIRNALFLQCFGIKVAVLNRHEVICFRLPDEAGGIGRLNVLFEREAVKEIFRLFVIAVVDVSAQQETEGILMRIFA